MISRLPIVALVAMVAMALPVWADCPADGSAPPDTSTSTIISALILSLIVGGVFTTAFFVLRPHFPHIYQPRTYKSKPSYRNSEPLPTGMFNWIGQFLKTPDSEVLRVNGLDAYMFITYLNMCLWIFIPIWVFSWIVLLPAYGARLPTKVQGTEYSGFNRFVFSHIVNVQPKREELRSSASLILYYFFTAWVLLNIYWRVKHFVQLRHEFLLSERHAKTIHARSFLAVGIPNEYLSETKVRDIYGHLPGGIQNVWINRDLKKLPELVAQRDKLVNQLEGAVTKLIKTAVKNVRKGKAEDVSADSAKVQTPDIADRFVPRNKRPTHRLGKIPCMGEKVDTIDYCRQELVRLNEQINTQRQQIVDDYDAYPPQSSAFVVFNRQLAAHMAHRGEDSREPFKNVNRHVEVAPSDVVWSNMNLNPYEQKVRWYSFWAVTWITVLFWIFPVFIVGLISNVDYISCKVGFLGWIQSIPGIPKGIIKAVLPTAMFAVLNMLLIMWLRFLAKMSGIPSKNGIELSLMNRFSIFIIVQNFLFMSVVSGASSQVSAFVDSASEPKEFVSNIAMAIPKASSFFLSYMSLQGISGGPMLFLQLVPLVLYYVMLKVLASTPRSIWHKKNDLGAPAWGVFFPSTLFMVVVAFGYMVLAPIVTGWAAVDLLIFYCGFRYLFLYVFDVKPDSETAGLFFPRAINFTLGGLYVAELVVALMFLFNAGSNSKYVAFGVLMIVLLVLTIAFHVYLSKTLFKEAEFPPLNQMNSAGVEKQALEQPYPQPPQQQQQQQLVQGGEASYYVGADGKIEQSGAPATHAIPIDGDKTVDSAAADEHARKAYLNPSRTSEQSELWYPDDRFGIGNSQVGADHQVGFRSTTEHTTVNEKGNIDEDAEIPPGESEPVYD